MLIHKIIIYRQDKQIFTLGYNLNGHLEYFLIDELAPLTEAIFLAKVKFIHSQNKLAFIEYTEGKTGAINLSKELALQAGSLIPCQMTWAGDEGKKAKFSSQLKFVGKYVILADRNSQPFAKVLHNSEYLTLLQAKYLNQGLVFRSATHKLADLSAVEEEIQQLVRLKELVQAAKTKFSNPIQLTSGAPKYMLLLRNVSYTEDLTILVNDEAVFERLLPYVELWQIDQLSLDESIRLDIDELLQPLIDYLVVTESAKLSIHKLSGINLIDVNSRDINLDFYKINYLAIEEIVRQIKLRDLTGIILIDFIKNMTLKQQRELTQKLIALFVSDWRLSKVLGFTQAGICEIVRNK
jgi:ribonuclease G